MDSDQRALPMPERIEKLKTETITDAEGNSSYAIDHIAWSKGSFKMLGLIAEMMLGHPEPEHMIQIDPEMSAEDFKKAMIELETAEPPKLEYEPPITFRWIAEKGAGPSQVMLLVALANELGFKYAGYEDHSDVHNALCLRPMKQDERKT